MADENKRRELLDDFDVFMNEGVVPRPPLALRDIVASKIRRDLNPRIGRVLTKLALLHTVAGSLSLLICSQFGMGRGHAVSHYFMGYGELACMAACGALFLGLTGLAAGFLLSRPELRVVRRSGYAPLLALGVLSLSVFFCFGADIALSIALSWLLGGLLTGIVTLETGGSLCHPRNRIRA